jgi:hypothetical protein
MTRFAMLGLLATLPAAAVALPKSAGKVLVRALAAI